MYYNYPDEYLFEVMKDKKICEVNKNELYRGEENNNKSNDIDIYSVIDCEYVKESTE